MRMNRLILFCIVIGLTCCKSKDVKIIPVTFLADSLINEGSKNFTKYFIIENYNCKMDLDSLAIVHICQQNKIVSKGTLRFF